MALRWSLALPFLLVTGAAGGARAQAVSGAGANADEVTALEVQIGRDFEALATEGCAVACRALESMQRSVAKLCALDGGPRCAGARATLREATDRVRSSCGECNTPPGGAPPIAAKKGASEPPPSPPPEPNAPSPERAVAVGKHGGCAGCTVRDDESSDVGAGALIAALALAALKRRRGRRVR